MRTQPIAIQPGKNTAGSDEGSLLLSHSEPRSIKTDGGVGNSFGHIVSKDALSDRGALSDHYDSDDGGTNGRSPPASPRPILSQKEQEQLSADALSMKLKYYMKLKSPGDRLSAHPLNPPPHVASFAWSLPFWTGKQDKKRSSPTIVFSIWNTMVGSALLSLPWAFSQAGVGMGAGLAVVVGTMGWWTTTLIINNGWGHLDFSDVCLLALGRWAQVLALISSWFTIIAALMSYEVLFTNSIISCVESVAYFATGENITSPGDGLGFFTPQIAPIFVTASLFPLLCFKRLDFLVKIASWGVLCVIYILLFILAESGKVIAQNGLDLGEVVWFDVRFGSLGAVFTFSFFIQCIILPIMSTHKRPEKGPRDTGLAFFAGGVCYLCVGVATNLAFPQGLPQDFFSTFDYTDVPAFTARLALVFHIYTVMPLLVMMIRTQFFSAILGVERVFPGYGWTILLNIIVCSIFTLVAIFFPNPGQIVSIGGAVTGTIYTYGLPVTAHVVINLRAKNITWRGATFAICVGVLGICIVLMQFVIDAVMPQNGTTSA
mmetsp:Transcript_18808/g.47726  ORF Transcript_18808/g.47726 Transcript_18808/m.47726 type:complete len:545 (-) Transcript_18808:4001-5635(-)